VLFTPLPLSQPGLHIIFGSLISIAASASRDHVIVIREITTVCRSLVVVTMIMIRHSASRQISTKYDSAMEYCTSRAHRHWGRDVDVS